MAITATVSSLTREVTGSRRRHTASLALTGTYVTNGFTLSPASFGLGRIDNVFAVGIGGTSYEWVQSTGKLKAFSAAGGTPTGVVVGVNAQPAFTLTTGAAIATDTVGIDTVAATGHLVAVTGQTFSGTFSPVGAATFTGTFTGTAVASAALAEFDSGGSLTDTVFVEVLGR